MSLAYSQVSVPGVAKVEVLYFDGCPTYRAAEEALREVLAEEGTEVEVNTDENVRRLDFPDSPTIRLDGEDFFPGGAAEQGDRRLGCRLYATSEGLRGTPTKEMIRAAVLAALG